MATTLFGKEVWTALEEKVVPTHTALIVVDVQPHVARPESPHVINHLSNETDIDVNIPQSILDPLARLLDEARRVGVLVVYTKASHRPDGLLESGPQLAWRLHRFQDEETLFMPWEGSSEICEEVSPQPQDLVLSKQRQPAFLGTNLDQVLRSNNIKTTIVTGLATSGCVDATIRMAFWLEYYPVVPINCVGEMHREWHQRGLENIAYFVPDNSRVDSAEIVNIWKKYPDTPRTASLSANVAST
jgi:ureidoacrylate peracid hydrolase